MQPIVQTEAHTPRHDHILNWLIDHVEEVVLGFTRPATEDWYLSGLEEARRVAVKRWRSWSEAFDDLARPGKTLLTTAKRHGTLVPVSDEARAVFRCVAAEIRTWCEPHAFPDPTPSLAAPRLEGYAVMSAVSEETWHNFVGFLDLEATVLVPSALFLAETANPGHAGVQTRPRNLTEFGALARAASMKRESVQWRTKDRSVSFVFDVRRDDFTLGGILQDLKRLAQHEDDPRVVLCVDGIDPQMRDRIAHEGFDVIDISAWNSRQS